MRIHLIIDFQYNYYRNKCSFDVRERQGRGKRLSSTINGEVIDTTYMYLTLKDIESYRKHYLTSSDGTCNEVVVSIAADSKSVERKEQDSEYKSNRGGRLDDIDFVNIERTLEVLKNVGYNVYKEDGYEADDIIRSLVLKYENDFDLTIIHTNDSDILVNLSNKVGVARFKSNIKTHLIITPMNFSKLMGEEFKCQMPYNCIVLYKSLVGDKSDKIKGATRFGIKAFDKAVDYLTSTYGESYFYDMSNPEKVEKTLKTLELNSFLSESQLEEAFHSLNLVKYKYLDFEKLKTPVKADSQESRQQEYGKYAMFSLV